MQHTNHDKNDPTTPPMFVIQRQLSEASVALEELRGEVSTLNERLLSVYRPDSMSDDGVDSARAFKSSLPKEPERSPIGQSIHDLVDGINSLAYYVQCMTARLEI